MTTQNDTAQAMGEAAALPGATKTEARTAFPTKETGNKYTQAVARQAQDALIFAKEVALVL